MVTYKNKAKCLSCGDVIESTHRHDYVRCSCGNLAVDGGHDYLKRNCRDITQYEEVLEIYNGKIELEKHNVVKQRGK